MHLFFINIHLYGQNMAKQKVVKYYEKKKGL